MASGTMNRPLGWTGMFFSNAVDSNECILIPSNANLKTSTYTATGKYFANSNTIAASLSNCPTSKAFQMLVYDILYNVAGEIRANTWDYRIRILMDYESNLFMQYVETNGSNSIIWGAWKKFTLTNA